MAILYPSAGSTVTNPVLVQWDYVPGSRWVNESVYFNTGGGWVQIADYTCNGTTCERSTTFTEGAVDLEVYMSGEYFDAVAFTVQVGSSSAAEEAILFQSTLMAENTDQIGQILFISGCCISLFAGFMAGLFR